MKSINVEGGFFFCGGWNFSKSVSVGPTFIREMRVSLLARLAPPIFSPSGITALITSNRKLAKHLLGFVIEKRSTFFVWWLIFRVGLLIVDHCGGLL